MESLASFSKADNERLGIGQFRRVLPKLIELLDIQWFLVLVKKRERILLHAVEIDNLQSMNVIS